MNSSDSYTAGQQYNTDGTTSVYFIAIDELFKYIPLPYLSLNVNNQVFSKPIDQKELQIIVFPVAWQSGATLSVTDATGFRLYSDSIVLDQPQKECIHVEGISPNRSRSITLKNCTNIRPWQDLRIDPTVQVSNIDVSSVKHEICSTIYLTDGSIRRTCHLLNPEEDRAPKNQINNSASAWQQQQLQQQQQPSQMQQQQLQQQQQPSQMQQQQWRPTQQQTTNNTCSGPTCTIAGDCVTYCGFSAPTCNGGCCSCSAYPSSLPSSNQQNKDLRISEQISWKNNNADIYTSLLR